MFQSTGFSIIAYLNYFSIVLWGLTSLYGYFCILICCSVDFLLRVAHSFTNLIDLLKFFLPNDDGFPRNYNVVLSYYSAYNDTWEFIQSTGFSIIVYLNFFTITLYNIRYSSCSLLGFDVLLL